MASIIGDVSDGFGDNGVVWYNFMFEPVPNIKRGGALIDTGNVI